MKTIDKDMIILLGLCLLFSFFLFTSKEKIDNYLGKIVKEEIVTVYRKDKTITLPLNKYLVGVVGCEVDASYHIEALKTQAIVARTYALRSKEINRRLTDDTTTQCYKDDSELKTKWKDKYDEYYKRIEEAILDTDDLAIYYEDKLIDALYYATSNGYTEDAINVWGGSIPYLVSVSSIWDKEDKNYKNTTTISFEDFINKLEVGNVSFEIISRDESGRVLSIKVDNKVFTGVEFRKLLGLKSTDFEIEITDKVNITTYGYGHGVGLSQSGANYLANNGYNYKEIIEYYYKGVNIK